MARLKLKGEKQGLTNYKKRVEIEERVFNLEQMSAKVVESVNNSFQQLAKDNTETAKTIHDFDLVMQAMMEVLGGKDDTFAVKVKEVLTKLKINELEAKAEKQMAELKVMETEGKIVKTEQVTSDNDFVVTSTKGDDGKLRYPTKSVGIVGMFIPAVKELLINKKAGETLTLPTGGTLEVLEVYKLSEPTDEGLKGLELQTTETPSEEE